MNNEIKDIINSSGKMKNMLKSVYRYNSSFSLNEKQEKLFKEILNAMKIIDRKYFAGENLNNAYLDTALPIVEGQTISQPSTVARMLLLLELRKGDKVLEIGTGSGWNACLISFLIGRKVISLETIPELKEKAEINIKKLKQYLRDEKRGEVNVEIKLKNILKNEINGKYDKIIFTAGILKEQEKKIEEIGKKYLKEQGKLICPYQLGPIVLLEKNKQIEKKYTEEEYVFVPLLR